MKAKRAPTAVDRVISTLACMAAIILLITMGALFAIYITSVLGQM